ncbi:hypothetical protein LCGC14_0124520 [marine sediment metagenome]|uniref:Uroporphyrinogen decarboxylase (URO-D) domain-containing protein n=1 Tax=marine sediment metagenome TaxID=412755 RepID=A0A0F9VLB3_9ZZZZ|nr:hypothetical protein [Phycisphaerae bacterium]HDZ42352.1 hypothetical protein [Phycisphaerae bacterium]
MTCLSDNDRQVLRDAAKQVAEIAADPAQEAKLAEWRRHNSMRPGKPLVLVYPEDVWDEFLPRSEMQCEGEAARSKEWGLRSRLYMAEHIRDDRPVSADWDVELVIDDPGCGLAWNYSRHDVDGGRRTEEFQSVIADDADPDQIVHNRTVTVDHEATQREFDERSELFGDILNVRTHGVRGFGIAVVDVFIQWRGIEKMMWDMIDRPQWLHRFFELMTESEIDAARQFEALGVLECNNGNNGVGSGGLGATDELPGPGFDGEHVRLRDMWGFSTSQIFSEVSPAMHDEFAITYEAKFLDLFGLNCYGCCEPLDKKVDLVRKLPRIRRLSMSPFVDWVVGAEAIGGDFIYSAKPQPSWLASDVWDIDLCRGEIVTILDACKANGCTVEFVLNSTLTSRNEPWRYDEWTDMVQEEVSRYA